MISVIVISDSGDEDASGDECMNQDEEMHEPKEPSPRQPIRDTKAAPLKRSFLHILNIAKLTSKTCDSIDILHKNSNIREICTLTTVENLNGIF